MPLRRTALFIFSGYCRQRRNGSFISMYSLRSRTWNYHRIGILKRRCESQMSTSNISDDLKVKRIDEVFFEDNSGGIPYYHCRISERIIVKYIYTFTFVDMYVNILLLRGGDCIWDTEKMHVRSKHWQMRTGWQ